MATKYISVNLGISFHAWIAYTQIEPHPGVHGKERVPGGTPVLSGVTCYMF